MLTTEYDLKQKIQYHTLKGNSYTMVIEDAITY